MDANDNELSYLEAIHFFVEVLDSFFGNVCELDLVFNFYKVRGNSVKLRFARHSRIRSRKTKGVNVASDDNFTGLCHSGRGISSRGDRGNQQASCSYAARASG